MEGLFYNLERGEITKLHLLRFYSQTNYVIAKSVAGDKAYLKKELANFKMDGFNVKGEPEFTFCGAFDYSTKTLLFKVENTVADVSNTWAEKDLLTFKGTIISDSTLQLTQTSKRTNYAVERVYTLATETEILALVD